MALGDPYIDLPEFMNRMEIFDHDDDPRGQSAIESASSDANEFCNRQFNDAESVSARRFKLSARKWCVVDDFSTATGLVVKGGNGFTTTLVNGTDFEIAPFKATFGEVPYTVYWRLNLIGSRRWPINTTSQYDLEVTARWGWGVDGIPTDLVEATYLRAAAIFRRRDSPEGVLGGGFDGTAIRVSLYSDPDFVRLLTKFRKHTMGRFGR